ncbi:nitrous oxide reductase accessory protein NosL [Candidatus Sulfurimonas marisnigri]|uniref:Nitrous oxide reductase accessory protein NosL n=1 Tax=Candidatus Sulfurimonas marisnigri TaxID=2740405 RepID=A0A7S7LYS8_9BACT|nr:nitrous oxide reductase accessory protein NosL [Candidatus Sulfurimonas marisnigri]QOY53887.1 nitrous oxide reductase accessory protein NosL [Candidatus Sulfurimonas marisnigri]
MKKTTLFLGTFLLLLSSPSLFAFTKESTLEPLLLQSGNHKHWCSVCGMSIKMNYKTSHTSKLPSGKNRQYCSIRCLALDMLEHKINVNEVKVIDVLNEELIDARTAFYVVGSDVKGTMTKVSKLAFINTESAEDFSIENGGEVVSFDKAINIANKSLESDIQMINKKKKKKIYPMGKKIFENVCNKDIEPNNYLEINELKSAIKNKNLCEAKNGEELKEKELQAVSIYLWEVKRFEDLAKADNTIKVTQNEKCPICGMFVYKYPKWAAQIFYANFHFSFDGVKDMMKYYFQHKDGISKIIVTDYYSQKAINAQEAYYVIGSDVYGPMGDEIIPFKNESEAKTFYIDHKGVKVLNFIDIKKEEVNKLD